VQGLCRILIAYQMCIAMGCGSPTDVADEYLRNTPADSDTLSGTQTDLDTALCEGLSAAPGDSERTIQVGNVTRSYILHVPSAHTGEDPVPLIIDYHAVQDTGETQLETSPYPAVTDSEGVIMAFPSGLSGPAGTAWNVEACCVDNVDDLAFSKEMVSDIATIACIDLSRVYAVGKATGGGMAYHLACHAADVFAAVAPSSFDLLVETVPQCVPSRPITVVSFRVTENTLIPYDGGYSTAVPGHPITFLGAVATLEKWAEINGCTGMASDAQDGCQSYAPSQCEGDAEVWLCTSPGTESQNGNPSIAWPILKQHRLP
jgi:polyhydroxybutyrate depolymerase